MKKLSQLFAIGLLICSLSFTASAQNSSKDGGSGDVSKLEKSRGADPNITVTSRKNGDGQESRVVDKNSRGGAGCKALFDNHTSYYIYCYVDGKLEGYVAPWGNGQIEVSNGTTSLYAVAEFNDGSKTTWGPISKSCNYQTFELEVYSSYYNWYLY